jgi:hypothetical protein
MRVSSFVTVLAALVGASSCRSSDTAPQKASGEVVQDSALAQERRRFGRPAPPARGDPGSVLALSPHEQAAVYQGLLLRRASLTDSGDSTADDRPWLDARLLAHEGGYEHYGAMPTALRQALLETGQFRGTCGDDPLAGCEKQSGTWYVFSSIYGIAEGAVRVFLASGYPGFATEKMYRLEQRGRVWVVVGEATIMVT